MCVKILPSLWCLYIQKYKIATYKINISLFDNCKDQLWLEPRIGMDPDPKSLNNKFVESGRKS